MPAQRVFHVVWVKTNHGIGAGVTEKADAEVIYTGAQLAVKAPFF